MIMSAQTLRGLRPVEPFVEQTKIHGMSYGLGPAGYDLRVDQDALIPPGGFVLLSTMEKFTIPDFALVTIHDKSTWARQGLALQNTVAEPGWCGYLTLEATNHSPTDIVITRGMPIAQAVFHVLDRPTDMPYRGKYQDQGAGPQPFRYEE